MEIKSGKWEWKQKILHNILFRIIKNIDFSNSFPTMGVTLLKHPQEHGKAQLSITIHVGQQKHEMIHTK